MEQLGIRRYWFTSHKYGLAWTPSSWQGWLVIILYLLFLMLSFIFCDKQSHSITNSLMNIAPLVVVATLALMWITYSKGEPPHWKTELEERF